MITLYNYSNYGNDLKITKQDCEFAVHRGDCTNEIEILMQKKYIKKQLEKINPEQLKKELEEYGAWEEFDDHNENLKRWLWISTGDIIERINEKN